MRTSACPLACAGLSLLFTGCGGGAPPPTASATVTDSAGVTIVDNPAELVASLPMWTVSAEPEVVIGDEAKGDDPLSQVVSVVPLKEGSVAVATRDPAHVLLFTGDGTREATLGRPGDGPGEFSWIGNALALQGDSIGVQDLSHRRLSVFSLDGTLGRELDLGPLEGDVSAFNTLLPLDGGGMVLFRVANFPKERTPGMVRLSTTSPVLDAQGAVVATLGPLPGTPIFSSERMTGSPAWGARTYGATDGDALVVGDTEETELRWYSASGGLERISRWPSERRAVTDGMATEWREAMVARTPESGRAAAREQIKQVPVMDHVPAFADLVTTSTGEVWVGDYPGMMVASLLAPIPERHWLVLSPEGAAIATATTPPGFQPYAIRDGRVWGVFKDDLDVETVRAFRIQRGDGAS